MWFRVFSWIVLVLGTNRNDPRNYKKLISTFLIDFSGEGLLVTSDDLTSHCPLLSFLPAVTSSSKLHFRPSNAIPYSGGCQNIIENSMSPGWISSIISLLALRFLQLAGSR